MSLRFSIVECFWRRLCKEVVGKVREYQSKSLVNKLFLRKKLYHLRMEDGDSVTDHLNVFNTLVSQLVHVDIKMEEEDKCITLLCSLLDLWDNLVSNR